MRLSSLDGANLRGIDINLSTKLQGVTIRGVAAEGASLAGVKLVGADAAGAQLQGAILDSAELSGVEFKGANLLAASMGHVRLSRKPNWEGEPIYLTYSAPGREDPWKELNADRFNRRASENIEAARKRLEGTSNNVNTEIEPFQRRRVEIRGIVTDLAGYLCSHIPQGLPGILAGSRWPGGKFIPASDITDGIIARQMLFSALLNDGWCKSSREQICLVARREMTTTEPFEDPDKLGARLGQRGVRIRVLPSECR